MKILVEGNFENRKCVQCGTEFEPKRRKHIFCSKVCANRSSKDKTRHGKQREKLISENGRVCSKCGKIGNRFEIVAHHTTFDNKDHKKQKLLCRSCHAKEHKLGEARIPLKTLTCEVCGVEFSVRAHRAKYCSRKCRTASTAEKNRERVRRWKKNNPERVKANKRKYYIKKKQFKAWDKFIDNLFLANN